jgi:tetratricopeptide (TPR) repeat protein
VDFSTKVLVKFSKKCTFSSIKGRFDKSRYEKALADYNKAIELEDNNSTAYNNRGVIWESLGYPDKALADYDRAISLKPNGAVSYKNRADLYETLNEFSKALEDYTAALEKDPKYPAAYNNRGFLFKVTKS